MSFFEELKRRNVFRVAIAYAVVAWLILQVVDVVLNNIASPDWVFGVTLMLLGAGFVVVVIFSWVFELTPEGIMRESDIDRDASITPYTGKKLDRLITSVLVLAIAYFVVDKFVLSSGREAAMVEAALEQAQQAAQTTPAVEEDSKSIAVLPFVNMSEEASNEYFSDGISEEILNSLAKVGQLKVAGRTSSFAFKGQNQDLRLIGEALGVANILEGSVRRAGNRVRITAQLVKVDDGFHLWSETYDRELNDVFAIQDEIATAILGELKAALLDEATPTIASARTDTRVFENYLQAKQRIYLRNQSALESAIELLDEAIAIDPDYAPAHAQRGIAIMLLGEGSYGDIPDVIVNAEGRRFVDRALELDPNLAEGWAALGLYYNGPPFVADKAIEALQRARDINPSMVDAGNWLVLAYWGVNRLNDSMALLDEITTRDPLYKPAFGNRVFLLMTMGRASEAREYIEKISPFIEDEGQILQVKGWVEEFSGNYAVSLQYMQKALQMQPNDRVFKVGVNVGHFNTHQFEQVFEDNFSNINLTTLVLQGRMEEAGIVSEQRLRVGDIASRFWFLNVSGQSQQVVRDLESRWDTLEAFEREFPRKLYGNDAMLQVAFAYQQTGQAERFTKALQLLDDANQQQLAQGQDWSRVYWLVASHAMMSGDPVSALENLAKAVDMGFVSDLRISNQHPWFKALEGNPEYEAIQGRMITKVNQQRALLGLAAVDG